MITIKNWKFMCLYLNLHNSYPGDDAEKIINAASNLLTTHGYPRLANQDAGEHWNASWRHASDIVTKKQKPQSQQLPPIAAYEEHKRNPIVQLEAQIEEQQKILDALIAELNRLKRQAELDLEAQELHNRQMALYRSPDFTRTSQWKNLRMRVLVARGAVCECCGASKDNTPDVIIEVDHIKPRIYYPELALEESNLQVLCRDCNGGKNNSNHKDWRQQKLPGAR